jgi:peptidoglycan hydrolase-like protein with peptidoglycan-binding domain
MRAFAQQQHHPQACRDGGSAKGDCAPHQSTRVKNPSIAAMDIGNQAMQLLLHSGLIQGKLKINAPGDVYEQEADRAAELVMRSTQAPLASLPIPLLKIQRKCAACANGRELCPECAEEDRLQTKEAPARTPKVAPAMESVIESIKGEGQPLPGSMRAFMEPRFGYNFSKVRVHTGAYAAESAREINALAYTVGPDIVFATGQYAPGTASGRLLLAHELTHVIQQSKLSGGGCTRAVQRRPEDRELLLTIGSSGYAVRSLQERLVAAGAALIVDGVFGPLTRAAVQAFQESEGLTADGIVGPLTWQALDSRSPVVPAIPSPRKGYMSMLVKLQVAIGGLHTLSVRTPSPPRPTAPSVPLVGLETTEEEDGSDDSSWDDAAEKAWGAATKAAEEASSAVTEAADEAWGTATGGVEEVWNAVTGTAEEVWGVATDGTERVSQVVEGAMGQVHNALADLGHDLRERYGREIAVLEGVVGQLGKGMQLGDEETERLGALIDQVIASLPIGSAVGERANFSKFLAKPGCTWELDNIGFREVPFQVDALGLVDAKDKIVKNLGSSTLGHVNLDAIPTMKINCLALDGTIFFAGGVKITATGQAKFPKEGKVGTSSADPERERTGIRDLFEKVKAHERRHVAIYENAFRSAPDELSGLTPAEAKRKFNFIMCEAFKAQDRLDQAEGCLEVAHGKDADLVPGSQCGNTGNAAASCPKD